MINTEAEYRDGYFVSEKTKKIWNVELDLFHKLTSVCQKYGLRCWALAGTMLGAVRHKGFIPWDDDIDVCLPRADFDKLKEVAATEFTGKYLLQTPENDPQYYSSTIRLRNVETTAIILSQWDGTRKKDSNQGIFIDIFPLDVWPDTAEEQAAIVKKAYKYNRLFLNRLYLEPKNVKERILKLGIKLYFTFFSYKKKLAQFHRECGKYNGRGDTLAYIARGKVKNDGYRYIWTAEETASTVMLPFEDTEIPVPNGYLSCLEKRYGNYMEFPPLEQRGKWHEDQIFFDPDKPYTEYENLTISELKELNK